MLTVDYIIQKIRQYKPDFNQRRLKQAYDFAKEAYDGKYRLSGDTYLSHALSVTDILIQLKPYEDTIMAALLHDVSRMPHYDPQKIKKLFGENVALFVDGMAKIQNLRLYEANSDVEILRKMVLSLAKYLRVILIRLADMQHNMETLDFVQAGKRKDVARETLDIYVPIASRLGIYTMKTRLEDMAFRYLYPEQYAGLKYELDEYVRKQEKIIDNVKANLEVFLVSKKIEGRIEGRLKSLYSIYTKLKRKSRTMLRDIHDIFALRLILPARFNENGEEVVEHLYTLLGLIHSHYTPLLNRFKDYIAVPKPNGYRSLHTTIVDFVPKPFNQPIELQLRSEKMHKEAEFGLAAHWLYEDMKGLSPSLRIADVLGNNDDEAESPSVIDSAGEKLKKYQSWFSGLTRVREDISGIKEARVPLKLQMFEDRIFVFTPKGDVKDLPIGSTPVDLAYSIHTDIGHCCHGARVNNAIVPLDYKLKSGEIVEILTQNKKDPKLHWLSFIKTAQARNKIKSHFKGLDKVLSLREGKDAVNKILKNMSLSLLDDTFSILRQYGDQKLSLKERCSLLEEIGNGSVSPNTVMKKVFGPAEFFKKIARSIEKNAESQQIRAARGIAEGVRPSQVVVGGASNVAYKFSLCCHPQAGDAIIAYVSRGNAVRIHLQNCHLLKNIDQTRTLPASWGSPGVERKVYPVKIRLKAHDRVGLIRDIADAVASFNVNIVDFAKTFKKQQDGMIEREIVVEVVSRQQLQKIISRLEQVLNVLQVNSVSGNP